MKKLDLFSEDPFHPQLKTHKLSGKLKMLWSFSIGYDLRVVFEFVTNNKVILEDIGTHNEVY
jgi:mRNA-degrading endonuclease YafQ of YafQ-DinJ toxin-antitoxin module